MLRNISFIQPVQIMFKLFPDRHGSTQAFVIQEMSVAPCAALLVLRKCIEDWNFPSTLCTNNNKYQH